MCIIEVNWNEIEGTIEERLEEIEQWDLNWSDWSINIDKCHQQYIDWKLTEFKVNLYQLETAFSSKIMFIHILYCFISITSSPKI